MPLSHLVNKRTAHETVSVLVGLAAILSPLQSVSIPQHFPDRTLTHEEVALRADNGPL